MRVRPTVLSQRLAGCGESCHPDRSRRTTGSEASTGYGFCREFGVRPHVENDLVFVGRRGDGEDEI
jgi:hypothetical protein